MASIGSVPSIGKTKLQKSVFLPNGSLNKTRFILSGLQGKNGSSFGFSVSIGVESYLGLSLNCVQRINWCSRRHGKCKAAKGEDGGEANDALEATIEKSKKVLAMQRDLLLQIAERRKLVSSIKNSIMNAEEDGKSFNEKDKSYSDLDLASTDSSGATSYDEFDNSFLDLDQASIGSSSVASYGEFDNSFSNKLNLASTIGDSNNGENPSEIFSGSYVSSTSVDAQRGEGEKKSRRTSGSDEVSLGVDFSQIQERSSEKVESELISFLPSETYGLDEKLEELTKMSSEDVDEVPVEEDVKLPPLAGANVMNVILVAAECAPWVKTGGLGDVAGSLPKALARRGHRVMVVVPQYAKYAELKETGVRKRYVTNGQSVEVTYSHAYLDGVDFVFLESSVFRHMEKDIYGGNRVDILKRMILFCKAAVEVPWHVPCGGVCYGDGNLVFIANDWHTALLPVYLKAYYRDNGIMRYARSVLVIHNIAHQGRGPLDDFSYVDLPEHYIELFKLYDPVGGDHFNIFAAGLKAADRIVTVSHGYAWELKTSEGGWGLHEIINENDWKLRGIVNGIDTKEWSPEVDVHLTSDGYANYSLETLQIGKAQCKAALQKELGLSVRENVPLIGFVGRLDPQKGVDLIAEAIPWMMDQDVQLVMLGSGRPDLEQMLRQYDSQYHNKIRGWVGFSVKTAHRITAGADILLMPSRFEPCGLNQLYAMKYGTVPVVHGVGGLRDTVQPFDPYKETGLGWTFDRAEANRLIHALANCLLTYREYKPSWEGLQRRGMMQDLSWDNAAQQYEEVLVAAKYQW